MFKRYLNLFLSLVLIIVIVTAYVFSITEIELNNELRETSGLELINNELITFNDSGGESKLYYLDFDGNIIYERVIYGAINNDWEDITKDSSYIYIADIGNNYDNRNNLNIIKVPIDKFSTEKAELIKFSYPEQTLFNTSYDTSQYDAEALITIDDKLIIFTKNKLKNITEVYSLPKVPGEYKAEKIGSIDTESVVTGGDYDKENKLLALTSTRDFKVYNLLRIKNFNLDSLEVIDIRFNVIDSGVSQIEAVKLIEPDVVWFTSEAEETNKSARLIKCYYGIYPI